MTGNSGISQTPLQSQQTMQNCIWNLYFSIAESQHQTVWFCWDSVSESLYSHKMSIYVACFLSSVPFGSNYRFCLDWETEIYIVFLPFSMLISECICCLQIITGTSKPPPKKTLNQGVYLGFLISGVLLFQPSQWLCKHLQYIPPSSGPFKETINQNSKT